MSATPTTQERLSVHPPLAGIPETITEHEQAAALVPVTPSEATKEAILKAAPNVFHLARVSTGVAAIIFEFVRHWKLYEEMGFERMGDYADAQLGVRGDNSYKDYARAGTAMWTHFGSTARQVIESISGGVALDPVQLHPPLGLPNVPSVSILRELPRALKKAHPAEHASILARVEAGECTYDELRKKGRIPTATQPASPVVPANDDLADRENGDGLQPDQTDPDAPAIFSNLPELNAISKMARTAAEAAKSIGDVWANDGGRDVDPIVPRVRVIADTFAKLATEIDDTIIPRTVCTACGRNGGDCDNCGGLGWLPRVPTRIKRTADRSPKARARQPKRTAASGLKKKKKKARK